MECSSRRSIQTQPQKTWFFLAETIKISPKQLQDTQQFILWDEDPLSISENTENLISIETGETSYIGYTKAEALRKIRIQKYGIILLSRGGGTPW